MHRTTKIASAVALALLAASTASAQRFSGVVTFGDSLSDAGNIAAANRLPAGNSFTTNADPVMAQILAAAFGQNQTNSLAGGSNYAWGGACAQAAINALLPPCVSPQVPRLNLQISQYLGTGSTVRDPNALFTVWMGANDIFGGLGSGLWNSTATISAGATATASAVIAQTARLQAAGARNIVVLNLPDLSVAPQFLIAPTANQQAANLASVTYNQVLNQGLGSLGTGIIPVNVFALVNEVRADPAAFGFTNVTGIACGPGPAGVVSSVACGPAGSGLPFTYAAGTNNTFLFADGVHPSGAGHRLLANVVLSTLEAPAIVSLAAEGPLRNIEDHHGSIGDAMRQFGAGEEGSVRAFANVRVSEGDIDASGNAPAADLSRSTASVGAVYQMDERFALGIALGVGNSNLDPTGGKIDGKSTLISLYSISRFGGFSISSTLTGGSSNLDISRSLVFPGSVRVETGETDASLTGGSLSLGYTFKHGDTRHGPFIGYRTSRAEISGYAEDSVLSTSMNYADIVRSSAVINAGYGFDGSFGDGKFQPYARIAWNQEQEDDAVFVNAGSNSMNGRFNTLGYTPSDEWISANLGLSMAWGESARVFLAYTGRFSDDQEDSSGFNIGVRGSF